MSKFKDKRTKRGGILGAKNDDYIGKWDTMPTPINQIVAFELQKLRARSREQALNNDYVQRFLTLMESNVVGADGIIFQSRIKQRNGKLNKRVNEAVEKHFKRFSKAKNFDYSGELGLIDVLNLIIRTLCTDGEYFLMRVVDSSAKYGVKFQLIDPERVDISYNAVLGNGNVIMMGIEVNARGERVNYHLLERLKTVNDDYHATGIKHVKVPAKDMIHGFKREFVGQLRGFPLIASSLYRLKIIEQYENTALIASKLGAANGGHYYRDENAGSFQPELDEEGNPIEEGTLEIEIEAGKRLILPEGYRYEAHDPVYPQQMYAEFMKKTLRGIASGLGISYNTLANDLEGVNFSSIRTAVLEDREIFKKWQRFLIDGVMEFIHDSFINYGMLKGSITSHTGKPIPATEDLYEDFAFIPRKWDWVDPQKDAKAKRELLDMNATTVSAIIRDTGRDPDEVFEERLKEQEVLKQLIPIDQKGETDNGQSDAQEDEESDTDSTGNDTSQGS